MKYLIMSGLSVLFVAATSASPISAQTAQQNSALPGAVRGIGNLPNYQYGTRIYDNGRISVPNGSVVYPATTIDHGNGYTTYYYQDGTHITTNRNTVNPGGTFLTPGSVNGGVGSRGGY
ncbi:MAG: hypothetical protein PUP93_02100 [Rhizonema sp. NSF051]|nr:hypothetical protein [Rhizonema sp. NSF051]